jgi:hypothetical protein
MDVMQSEKAGMKARADHPRSTDPDPDSDTEKYREARE